MQQCSSRAFTNNRHWYYYCNRSGLYRKRGIGIRHTKSQGTSKIGERCIAHIKAIEDITSGEVSVEYCSTHHNHDINLGHLRIQHDTRMKIVAQLQQGLAMSRIMDNIRGYTGCGITREHLITKQDIHNIKMYTILKVLFGTTMTLPVCMHGLKYVCPDLGGSE